MLRPLTLLSFALAAAFANPAIAQPDLLPVAQPAPLPLPQPPILRVTHPDQLLPAAEQLPLGGTLLIEPGNYHLPRPLVLRGKTNITLRSASGHPESVVLYGRGWTDGDEHDDILRIADCDGVTVAGLTFAECRSYGVKIEAEHGPRHIHIVNCRFRNIGTRAIKGSAGQDPTVRAVNGSVRFCTFENTRVPPETWLFNGDYISAIDMMALDHWTFSDNCFRNIRGRHGGGRAALFIWVRSRNILVERNVIADCDRGLSFGNPGQSTANQPGTALAYVANAIVRNNWISGGTDGAIELWHANGIQILHNSIWRPEQNWSRGIRVGTGTTNAVIANNLIHGEIRFEGGSARTENNLSGKLDHVFVDPSAANLALAASATNAIDAAVILPAVPRDIQGGLRTRKPDVGAWESGGIDPIAWVDAMQRVHANFKGRPGTLAIFGDSISYSRAFWSPLAQKPRHLDPVAATAWQMVRDHLLPECLDQEGPNFGNQSAMTILWAEANVDQWLTSLNPEVAVILFGSNDVAQLTPGEYERALRAVIRACLDNGSVVILTTPPPQAARLPLSLDFARITRDIAAETRVPLIDYCAEILTRRPDDWDGSSPRFRDTPGDTYDVPTLISRDGVHPSNPSRYANDFSQEALAHSGYGLRNYLTLLTYADVLRQLQNRQTRSKSSANTPSATAP